MYFVMAEVSIMILLVGGAISVGWYLDRREKKSKKKDL